MDQLELNSDQRSTVLASIRAELDDVKQLLKQLSRGPTNDIPTRTQSLARDAR
jgi:hypothetical protein